MKRSIILISLVLMAAAAIGFRLHHNAAQSREEISHQLEQPPVRVKAMHLARKKVSLAFTARGTAHASQVLELTSETEGKVMDLYFQAGQKVAQGQTLLRLDARLKRAAHQIHQINYEKARRNLERMEALFQENNLSALDLENARLELWTQESQLKISKRQLEQTIIQTPFSGVMLEKKTTKGSYLQPGTPVATIADVSRMKIIIHLPENSITRINTGDQVTIQASVYPGASFKGIIRAVIPQAGASNTYPVEILFHNRADKPLLAGMGVDVILNEHITKEILPLPRTAIAGDLRDSFVYLIDKEGKAQKKAVVLGNTYGREIEVLEGLQENDLVVVSGNQNIESGQKVNPSLLQ